MLYEFQQRSLLCFFLSRCSREKVFQDFDVQQTQGKHTSAWKGVLTEGRKTPSPYKTMANIVL